MTETIAELEEALDEVLEFPAEEAPKKKRRDWSYPKPGDPRPERAALTEEEWARVLGNRKRTAISLVTAAQREWAGNQAVDCGSCKGVHLYGDPRRGFCVRQEMMVGISFPKLCRKYEAR